MTPTVLSSRRLGACLLEAVLGDLTEERVDAIVNAANSHLEHGGGLAAAIVTRGGEEIQTESRRLAPVPVGGAAATTAGRLPARWVVHAVGPRWGEGDEEATLRSAVRSSLAEAARLGARSVALPAISTGIFGYPKREGTATLVREAVAWLDANPGTMDSLRFTAFDRPTAELLALALSESLEP